MTFTFNNKQEVIRMIIEKINEVTSLQNEGHMPIKESKKLLTSWKSLVKKISQDQYDIQRLPKQHPDLFISQTMLYHPDNQDVMNELIKMLGIR